jgi:hypothetical protein
MLPNCAPHGPYHNVAGGQGATGTTAPSQLIVVPNSGSLRPPPSEDALRAAIARLVGDSATDPLSAKCIRRRLEAEFACSLAAHGYREFILAATKQAIDAHARLLDAAGHASVGAAASVSSLAPALKQPAPVSEEHQLAPPAVQPLPAAPHTETPTVLDALLLAHFQSNSLFVARAHSASPPQPLPVSLPLPLPLPVPLSLPPPLPVSLPPLQSQQLAPASPDEQLDGAACAWSTQAEQLQHHLLQLRRGGRQAREQQPAAAAARGANQNEQVTAAASSRRGRKRAAPQPPSPSAEEDGPDTPSFQCDRCGHCSATSSQLAHHLREQHGEERPYACDLCSFRSAQKGNLNQHRRSMHTDERPYACTFCDYRTAKNSHLTKHNRARHSDLRPFACDECTYRSADRSNLNQHKKTAHSGELRFGCDECGFRGANVATIAEHKRLQHSQPQELLPQGAFMQGVFVLGDGAGAAVMREAE